MFAKQKMKIESNLIKKNRFCKDYNQSARKNFYIYLRFSDSYKIIAFPLHIPAV